MVDYKLIKDEKLVELAQTKDVYAINELLDRYKKVVKKIARHYFLLGGDSEDLIQEGTIAVFRAMETYKSESPFYPYVYQCIKNGIISLVRRSAAGAASEVPLASAINDGYALFDDEVAATCDYDPEINFINSEAEKELTVKLKKELSKLEYEILNLYLEGYSYSEIAQKLSKNEKSVDNALQRIKKKTNQIYGG